MGRIKTILLLLDTSKTAIHRFLAGIAKYSRLHGPWTFNREPPFYMARGKKHKLQTILKEIRPDGVIAHDTEGGISEEILDLDIPLILLRNVIEHINGMSDVVGETSRTSIMAAEHLLARGFTNFAFCGYPGKHYWISGRSMNFAKKINEHGYDVNEYVPPRGRQKRNWEYERIYLMKWLTSLPKPVGIMACNDDRSQDIVEACKMAGLHVPEEIAIIGVDNDTLICELSNPPLSSVAINSERAGFEAAELLDELTSGRIDGDHTIEVQPTHIVVRQSTDVLAINDPAVAKALNYIQVYCNDMIQVDDVVEASLVSRRVLQQRFKQVLGRSIRDEIRRVRVERIVQMLIETNRSISEIADAMGFPDVNHIARYFRNEKGVNLLEFRKKFAKK